MQNLVAAVCMCVLNKPLQQAISWCHICLQHLIEHAYMSVDITLLPLRIKLPVSSPTACAFAGTDLSVLYITTLDDKSESKGTGGLWSYELPGLSGWSASYVAKPV